MNLKVLLMISAVALVSSCSSKPKNTSLEAPAQTVTPTQTEAPAKVEAPKNEMTCKRDKENRLLEVETVIPKGCKLWYSRYETKNVVATSVLGISYCEKVRENIRTNLVEAGFECK